MDKRKSKLATLRLPQVARKVRELRGEMTDAEMMLWYYLRARRFLNRKIRRQVPLGPYIVDFLCHEGQLVIEVDGGQHQERMAVDAARTAWLQSHGYRVIRFWNHEVLGNTDGVLEAIAQALSDPLPDPPPRGRETL